MRINSFINPVALEDDLAVLSQEESHHLARVLRVEPGQEMTLFDGKGTRASGIVKSVSKKEVCVQITKREKTPPKRIKITLFQGICKPNRFEMILQKATELGISTIQPIETQNVSQPDGKRKKMVERGETIIRNAAQQCGTAWMPELKPLKKLSAVFHDIKNIDACFIGSLHPNAESFKDSFAKLDSVRSAALLIGPEGDFSAAEVDDTIKAGAIPVTFGDQILRTETAAIFGMSILSYELF